MKQIVRRKGEVRVNTDFLGKAEVCKKLEHRWPLYKSLSGEGRESAAIGRKPVKFSTFSPYCFLSPASFYKGRMRRVGLIEP